MGCRASCSTPLRAVLAATRLIAWLVLCNLTTSAAASQVRGPIPNGRLSSGKLSFDGHATVGDFTGTTETISGQSAGASELSGVRGWVESPVHSLKTGDRKRDKDLNKSMESDKYPNLRFDLAEVLVKPGSTGSVTLRGTLKIHGVSRRVDLPATLSFDGAKARVKSDFPLNLKEYQIGGLSKMLGMLKMDEHIQVHVDLVFQLASKA
jgi:polyisoprenoid-binding protein YceI